MQIDAIRPMQTVPIVGTESGTPVLPRETSIPFGAIMPPPILPEEGAKTRDRNANPQKPDVDESVEKKAEDVLPEPFKLILGKDFAEFLRYLSVENHAVLFQTTQKVKSERGVFQYQAYPDYYVQTLPKTDAVRQLYEYTAFFYHTRPGERFIGKM